jgi:hypothetical protein
MRQATEDGSGILDTPAGLVIIGLSWSLKDGDLGTLCCPWMASPFVANLSNQSSFITHTAWAFFALNRTYEGLALRPILEHRRLQAQIRNLNSTKKGSNAHRSGYFPSNLKYCDAKAEAQAIESHPRVLEKAEPHRR